MSSRVQFIEYVGEQKARRSGRYEGLCKEEARRIFERLVARGKSEVPVAILIDDGVVVDST